MIDKGFVVVVFSLVAIQRFVVKIHGEDFFP